jgi:5-methylcytosine-specific restriction endonuclease McrA
MPLESTTIPYSRTTRQGSGHALRDGAWRERAIVIALELIACSQCGQEVRRGETLTRGGPASSSAYVCSRCRPFHADRRGDESCWLCQRPPDPAPAPLASFRPIRAETEPQLLQDDTDLAAVARFFGVTKAHVFDALSPFIFDDKIERRLIWKLVLQACEDRHGGLAAIEKRIDDMHRRRSSRRAVPGHVSSDVRLRDQGFCRYCAVRLTRSSRTMDHVIPVALGGSNDPDNIVQCCRLCNAKKRDDIPSSAGMYLLPPGTTRMTITPVRDRRPLIAIPGDQDWPALVTGETTYQQLASASAARRQKFVQQT